MSEITLEKIDIDKIIPYENNAKRHPKKQVERIMKSIQECDYNDPIAIDENNVIVEGHGRLLALKELKYKTIEVIRLKGLTEQQKMAYILNHNKINMETGFDEEVLLKELGKITEIDMSEFGFDVGKIFNDVAFKENARQQTNDYYNLGMVDFDRVDGFYQMPVIKNDGYIPDDLMGFNYAKTSENKHVGIHFYLDDYQFERLWNTPENYIAILKQYDCILSPDFSLFLDMPMAMKIWNVYRSRMVGQFYQDKGIKVIPTISWAEKETFKFCFDGIPKGSIVSISTLGIKRNKDAMKIWVDGVNEMIKRIAPSTILIYGGKVDYDFGNIDVRYFENKVTERFK